MALTAAQRNTANTYLANLATFVTNKQNAYFTANGRYFQGRRLIVSAPTVTDHPTDQTATWNDFGVTKAADLPDGSGITAIEISCHTYVSPSGPGWVGQVDVSFDGSTYWRRVKNFGPETWRDTSGWDQVVAA